MPNVGKSTLFNALTAVGAEASNYPFCTIEPNVGIVAIPEGRLETINQFIDSRQITHATLRLVDIAGLVRGANQGEGLGNKFLSHIREVDAIIQVVRCFGHEGIPHVEGAIDTIRDMETIETELLLADLQSVEGTLERVKRTAKGGDKEAQLRALLLEQCYAALSQGQPICSVQFTNPEHLRLIKGMGLLTLKKILYVANVDESDIHGQSPLVNQVRTYAQERGGKVVPICAKIESELAELDETDRQELLEALGMSEPALFTMTRAIYQLLGLHSFFTAGPKEIRAWPIPVGATAPQAAGEVHSDFEKGFIRAEVFQVDDLVQHGSEATIRSAGKMRLEGKSYVVQDGDVCHFLFNV